jgi:hypothetical protein
MIFRFALITAARAALALAFSLVARTGVGAEPVRVYLDYSRAPAAATCLDGATLKRDVELRLGRSVFVSERDADVRAVVVARRVARGFAASVELFDGARQSLGRRELSTRARHCSALDDSLALVLSLSADMPRERLNPPAPPPSSPSGPSPPVPTAPSPPAVAPPSLGTPLSIPDTPPRFGLRLLPEIAAAAASGLVPSLAPGLDVGLELRSNRFWPVSVHAAGWARQVQEVRREGRAARFTAQTLTLAICPFTGPLGPLEGSLCVLDRLAHVAARGTGFDLPQESTGWQVALGAGGNIRYWLGPLFISGAGELLVPMLRRRYFFTDVEDINIYEEGWLQTVLRLGIGTEI